MDRNQVIGLSLIFLILISYFTFFAPEPDKAPANEKPKTETAKANSAAPGTPGQPGAQLAVKDTGAAVAGPEQTYTLENKDIKVEVSSQGARIKSVLLKGYKTYNKQALYVLEADRGAPSLSLSTPGGLQILDGMAFTGAVAAAADGGSRLDLTGSNGYGVSYRLAKEGFQVSTSVKTGQASALKIDFPQQLALFEKDFSQSRAAATINYYTTDEEFDNLNETATDSQKIAVEQPVTWVAHKQKFFLAGLIQRGKGFTNVQVNSVAPETDTTSVKNLYTAATLPASSFAKPGVAEWDYYFGPNKYRILKSVAPDFERNVYLGWPLIRWINKYLVVNVFDFLERFIGNYGIIITVLVLLIRIILLPLSFKSYVSMAKMKVLKPEIDAIKEKHGDDMAAVQQDQMKLYNQVGINPLSGCIPLLLQMPILLAMFNFFPSAIELRQEHLWWAEDLSTFDSIASLPFSIPGYGNHVSLFTILMTISTLAITWFNNQTNTVQQQMVFLSYLMPVVFMFVLNSLPAGLSFYYLISNVVSLIQQIGIRRFVDEGKIRARLEENKVKNVNKKPGKFAARLEAAMRSAEEARRQQGDQQQGKQLPPKKGPKK